MSRLDDAVYLDHLQRESARFRDVLADCTPDARVPSAPEWTATDLLAHLCKVQLWWAEVVVSRPAEPADVEPERPATYAEQLELYDTAYAALIEALRTADPAESAWTWSSDPADHTIAFILRRQTHEALIHRLDAELTAGAVTALDPTLAFDGAEECLDVMYGGLPPWGRFDPLPHHVEFRVSDVGASIWARLGLFSGTPPQGEPISGEQDLHVVPDPGVAADAVVTGTAGDLDAWLWHRRDDSGITVTGDLDVYDRIREVLAQPIN